MIAHDPLRFLRVGRVGRWNTNQISTSSVTTIKADFTEGRFKNEKHRLFDEAVITVKGGNGGNGQIVHSRGGKYVRNFKYNPGHNTPKRIWLPHGDPADGGDGGDVVLYCDPAKDSLLDFHVKKSFRAKKGIQGDPEEGTQAPKSLTRAKRIRRKANSLRIGVPPGTVIKRKGNGRFLGDIVDKRDEVIVAKGGQGGQGVIQPSKKRPRSKQRSKVVEYIELEDDDWRKEAKGQPGEELTLHLLLRVVADVGFVGLPNVGKSSLLKALTAAQPQVAAYPFTTLIPNLGVMGMGGDPILVDLPGLIEGAHVGKGLGKNFLRHLRRTRVLLHVVDVSQEAPAVDYESIRRELWMYNPQYCHRPHIIALNMIDKIEEGSTRIEEVIDEIENAARSFQSKDPDASLPIKIINTSAVNGIGIEELRSTLQEAIGDQNETNLDSIRNRDPSVYDPTW